MWELDFAHLESSLTFAINNDGIESSFSFCIDLANHTFGFEGAVSQGYNSIDKGIFVSSSFSYIPLVLVQGAIGVYSMPITEVIVIIQQVVRSFGSNNGSVYAN